MLVDQKLKEIDQLGLGAAQSPLQGRPLLGRGEVRAEEKDRQLALSVKGVGKLAKLLAHRVQLAAIDGNLKKRLRIYPRCFGHRLVLRPREGREVDLAEGVLNQAPLILGVE